MTFKDVIIVDLISVGHKITIMTLKDVKFVNLTARRD